jgi:hypothetical protein
MWLLHQFVSSSKAANLEMVPQHSPGLKRCCRHGRTAKELSFAESATP